MSMTNDYTLPTPYQNYIAASRYARYRAEDNRRETWDETVNRYCDWWQDRIPSTTLKHIPLCDIRSAIRDLQVMPSMRCLMTAGPALDRDHVAGYNCSYVAIDNLRAFDEILYILMCGTGVGFSVERQYINQLPSLPEHFDESDYKIIFDDSKIGWAKGFRKWLSLLYSGTVPSYDLSNIRPAGSLLKTFGGRASGPGPLEDLLQFSLSLVRYAAGRKLNSMECHDLVCKIAEVVVCGGVRRSALLSLSNLTDERMRHAKSGEWWTAHPHRALANNSVCYTEKPDVGIFMREWTSLYESKSGERGIFSRPAACATAARTGRRDPNYDFGTNPCSEIILRPNQFCNLSEVVVRSEDTAKDLRDKIRLATYIGTLQATLTDFRYLTKRWRDNTEDERLLGVSLTGIYDNELTRRIDDGRLLSDLRTEAITCNEQASRALGIPQSTSITCVKPSGTVSQLVNAASGIHPRYAHHYIRRVRADKKDPLADWMIQNGQPFNTDSYNPNAYVFDFPIKSPDGAVVRNDVGAIDQLDLWKHYATHYCEHKPSITVYVRESEWLDVGAWVYKNFDQCTGLSFLPYDTGSYRQAPYEEITSERYDRLVAAQPVLSFNGYREGSDNTVGSQELACVGGACEL